MKPLFFKSSGWCPELNLSYEKGTYLPKSQKEYDILKKYASDPNEVAGSVPNNISVEEINKLKTENESLRKKNDELLSKIDELEKQLNPSLESPDDIKKKASDSKGKN